MGPGGGGSEQHVRQGGQGLGRALRQPGPREVSRGLGAGLGSRAVPVGPSAGGHLPGHVGAGCAVCGAGACSKGREICGGARDRRGSKGREIWERARPKGHKRLKGSRDLRGRARPEGSEICGDARDPRDSRGGDICGSALDPRGVRDFRGARFEGARKTRRL